MGCLGVGIRRGESLAVGGLGLVGMCFGRLVIGSVGGLRQTSGVMFEYDL